MRLDRIHRNDLNNIDDVFSALDVDNSGHLDANDIVSREHNSLRNRTKRLKAMTSTTSKRHGKHGKNHGKQKKDKHGKQKQKHELDAS
jgi:hypothetical protein